MIKQKEDAFPETSTIKNIWKYNCQKEFSKISQLIDEGFNHVAMDTEFPGFLFDCSGKEISPEVIYQVVKMNVDKLNAIQVGFTLANEKGEKPEGVNTWQFNLCFNVKTEHHSPDSINMLNEAGIKFDDMLEHGIDHMVFGDFLMSSGLVINTEVQWITFHGCYDFAYLMKLLLNSPLPSNTTEFTDYLQHLFPVIWDVKVLINDFQEYKNDSLSKLAMKLDLKRSGITHQAGSDAMLTANVFFKIMKLKFPSGCPDNLCNKVFGLSFGGNLHNMDFEMPIYNQTYQFPSPYMYSYGNFSYDPATFTNDPQMYYAQQPMFGNMMGQSMNAQYPPNQPAMNVQPRNNVGRNR